MARGLILGIESSCDETAAAVVERGAWTLSSVVASQIATHARYGGVVPELASREHLRAIVPVVRAALAEAQCTLADLDAIAVTSGPGLAGALLVGITYAKSLAYAQGLPLIAVNHLEGHIHAVLLHESESTGGPIRNRTRLARRSGCRSRTDRSTPALALVVSGGHTHLYLAQPAHGLLDLHPASAARSTTPPERPMTRWPSCLASAIPGGPWIDALALHRQPAGGAFFISHKSRQSFIWPVDPRAPRLQRLRPSPALDPHFLFSFSGIKTAVLRYVELHNLRPEARSSPRSALYAVPMRRARPSVEDALATLRPDNSRSDRQLSACRWSAT